MNHQHRHEPEEQTEDSKRVCTVTAAQYLTCSERPVLGRLQPYLSPSPSPTDQNPSPGPAAAEAVSTPAAATAITTSTASTSTASSPSASHCEPAIPAASGASPALPVPSLAPELPVAVVRSECNTNHVSEQSADAMVRVSSPVADRADPESCGSGSPDLRLDEGAEHVNRIKDEPELGKNRTILETRRDAEGEESCPPGLVNKCSAMEEEEEAMDSPVGEQEEGPCLKSSTAGSCAESPSPDRDSSLRSCTSPSSSTTTTTTVPTHQQSQDSPADSPSHEMQLLCNTSVRLTSCSNDSPLHEQNTTSPSHHSDSGIASSASQQDTDPQPVLRQAIDCNNSPADDEHSSDDLPSHHPQNNVKQQSPVPDEASLSSADSSSPPPPPVSLSAPSSRQTAVFKFSSLVSKPVPTVAPGPVVQTTSPIVAHKQDLPVVAVNGTSHSKCSDDDSSSGSHSSASPPPPHSVPVKRPADVLTVTRSDQPDATPDLCFNDGETRAPTVVVLPEPPPAAARRLIHSVASGDHNYISVIDGRDVEWSNHRSHSNHNNSRAADESLLSNHRIDQNHSDLNTRPNKRRKCSTSTSSDNIHTIGIEAPAKNNNNTSSSNSSSGSGSSRAAGDQRDGQRSGVCSESPVESATSAMRNNCKFPIMNGHTYEV